MHLAPTTNPVGRGHMATAFPFGQLTPSVQFVVPLASNMSPTIHTQKVRSVRIAGNMQLVATLVGTFFEKGIFIATYYLCLVN